MNKNNYLLALNIINRMVKEGALTSEEFIIAERKIAEKYCIKDNVFEDKRQAQSYI